MGNRGRCVLVLFFFLKILWKSNIASYRDKHYNISDHILYTYTYMTMNKHTRARLGESRSETYAPSSHVYTSGGRTFVRPSATAGFCLSETKTVLVARDWLYSLYVYVLCRRQRFVPR